MDLHLADCFKKKSLEATQKIMAYYYYTNKALVYHIVSITHYCISNYNKHVKPLLTNNNITVDSR